MNTYSKRDINVIYIYTLKEQGHIHIHVAEKYTKKTQCCM